MRVMEKMSETKVAKTGEGKARLVSKAPEGLKKIGGAATWVSIDERPSNAMGSVCVLVSADARRLKTSHNEVALGVDVVGCFVTGEPRISVSNPRG